VTALRAERTFYPRETAPFVMAREDSVNIDATLDLRLAELFMRGGTS
jgi:CMP-N-acetylneuraminic acid synthetase